MKNTTFKFKLYWAYLLVPGMLLSMAAAVQANPTRDPHSHGAGSVTWSAAVIPPANPDTTMHQHNSALVIPFGAASNASFDAYGCWDSEILLDGVRDMWRVPVGAGNGTAGTANYGHCFIGDDFLSAIEYSFVGAGWNDDNKALFNAAFQEWETEAKTRANGSMVGEGGALVRNSTAQVGINFDEDTLLTIVNFEVRWAATGGVGNAAVWYADNSPWDAAANDVELAFNTGALFNNAGSETAWDSDPEALEWDFYSVALHEIGHILGLEHLDVGGGTNLMASGANSFDRGDKHRFIDTSDLQGAIDLYSIPEPSSFVLIALGGFALLTYGWRCRFQNHPRLDSSPLA